MTETKVRSDHVPRRVGAAAEAVLGAHGDTERLKAIFERSAAPMVMVDHRRRYVNANRPARLWFRLSLDEMRVYAIDDLAPRDQLGVIEQQWSRLTEAGCVVGSHSGVKPDGSRVDVVYVALADVLPGVHIIVFAPADWPEDELGVIERDVPDPSALLTPREIEVLALAADGLSGPELARGLVLSPTTVNTHFKNIYEKLDVRNRAAAVAKAMRLGLIE
jgi:DNA-binding CsgD family transcriptional regulator